MTSTGNDVVALKAIDIARTKQPNFYKKILSVSEKELYDRQFSHKIPLEIFVWILWSIKESAYKYLQRITPELVFSPTRTVVSQITFPPGNKTIRLEGCGFADDNVYTALVAFGKDVLYSCSIIDDEFIFSVVIDGDSFEHTCWGVKLIDSAESEYQSKSVREFLLNKLNTLFPGDDLQIGKSSYGYPVILKDEVEIEMPVSLAHHDRYVAYSFQVER
ncbi:MAG TPA: 4'-phosphopantetheinyl transferase superfamily protein [Mucilaginibacter sp.]